MFSDSLCLFHISVYYGYVTQRERKERQILGPCRIGSKTLTKTLFPFREKSRKLVFTQLHRTSRMRTPISIFKAQFNKFELTIFLFLGWLPYQSKTGPSWRCPWCNGYRHRNWTRRYEFKSWTRLNAFHIALIPLGKVWIQLLSIQLWVNSRTD